MRFLTVLCAALLAALPLAGWDGKIHPGIVHASLMAIPPEDRIQQRWGDEVWRLRQYVQMADWINTLVTQREEWDTGGQTLELSGPQFFANDFLLFPSANHAFQHMVPDVKGTSRPYFLRALQALRTESPVNAARWVGSLLHFVTDSGSPPHTIGVKGPAHTKMESWLDTSLIDLSRYQPRMLGDTDQAALDGLDRRMDALIAFSAVRANAMLPFVKVDDREHMEPLAVESAAETARVAADVIHTLLRLTAASVFESSLDATVSAPQIDGMENVPAKLVILDSGYSTMSDQSLPGFRLYRGSFALRNIPSGNYRVAIERVASRTLFATLAIKPNETAHASWDLQPDAVKGNLAPNPDLKLRWLTREAPDHWRFDAPRHQWLSDNIPVIPGKAYRAGFTAGRAQATAELQWMAHAWEPMKAEPVPLQGPSASVTVPAGAIFVRFVVKSSGDPSSALDRVFFTATSTAE